MGSEQSGTPALTGAYAELDPEVGRLLHEILHARDPKLHGQLCRSSEVDDQQVSRFNEAMYREFVQHLGDDWEPTEYGKRVDDAIGIFIHLLVIDRRR